MWQPLQVQKNRQQRPQCIGPEVRIGVALGTATDRDLTVRLPKAKIERFTNTDETVAAFMSGRVDAIGFVDDDPHKHGTRIRSLPVLGDRNALPSPYEVDGDGDNRISLAEVTRRFTALFDRYDLNKDGSLTRAELVTIRAAAPVAPGGRWGRQPAERR